MKTKTKNLIKEVQGDKNRVFHIVFSSKKTPIVKVNLSYMPVLFSQNQFNDQFRLIVIYYNSKLCLQSFSEHKLAVKQNLPDKSLFFFCLSLRLPII